MEAQTISNATTVVTDLTKKLLSVTSLNVTDSNAWQGQVKGWISHAQKTIIETNALIERERTYVPLKPYLFNDPAFAQLVTQFTAAANGYRTAERELVTKMQQDSAAHGPPPPPYTPGPTNAIPTPYYMNATGPAPMVMAPSPIVLEAANSQRLSGGRKCYIGILIALKIFVILCIIMRYSHD